MEQLHILKQRIHLRMKKWIANFSSIQVIVVYYTIALFVAFGLLSLPYFHQPNVDVPISDMLFMAVSTISVTGLSTFDIHAVFNQKGIILLELLFQIGGLGIMMISTFVMIISHRKISLRRRQLIMTDMNQPKLSGIVRLIQVTFSMLLIFQAFFGLIFTFYFHWKGYYSSFSEAAFQGFYQSISAITNSGFDITGESLQPFAHDFPFLLIIMFLIFIGGIGFPVLVEVKEWLTYKKKPHGIPFRFSLFSKLALSSFIILFLLGTLLIFLLERNHMFQDMSLIESGINSMFYSVTTRNVGMQIHDLNQFQEPTLLIFAVLMFIGCSPSSVGGGVRTTTIAILVLYIYSFIHSESSVNIFGRKIDNEDVRKSVVVFNLSLLLCFSAVLILNATEKHSLISIIMEVASAFGTTGLSLGITSDLSSIGKFIIGSLMFIGRIGMLYMLMLFIPKETRDLGYDFPTEKIIIG